MRGLGATLPLPYLNIMEAAVAKEPTQRFVALFKPNGVHPPTWEINEGQEHDFEYSSLMQPLEKHKKELLVLGNMGTHAQSGHQGANLLCGQGQAKGASMDQVLAKHIGEKTVMKSLELTTEGIFTNKPDCSFISYDEKSRFVPRNSDAQLVFDQLFRNPVSNPRQQKQIASVLDSVRENAKSLDRNLGKEDQRTMDEFFSMVRDTERKISLNKKQNGSIDFSDLKRPKATSHFNQQVDQMLDLIVMALQTDSTRVISYMLGNDNSRLIFDFLGVDEEHHYLSHFFRNFSIGNINKLNKINLWHIEKFASLISKLKQVKEGGRTLLDNTVVLFGSGMGHSDIHSGNRIPMLLAGGKDHIKTGRYVNHAKRQDRRGLLLTLLKSYGVEIDSFQGYSSTMTGLKDSNYEHYVEKKLASHFKQDGDEISLQGKFRLSTDLKTPRLQLMDIDGVGTVKIEVQFKEFNSLSLPFYYNKYVNIKGKGQQKDGEWQVTSISSIKEIE